MKPYYSILLLLSFLVSRPILCQDTLSIYFEFGHSKITKNHEKNLNSIPTRFDLTDLDSAYFIGMTDSIGNTKANFKLSEKRSKNTARYCENLFPQNIMVRNFALGEKQIDEQWKNRRVDIILYFKPAKMGEINQITPIEKENFCYEVDYELLHRSHIRTVKKRRKNLVLIETTVPALKRNRAHYYGSTSRSGEFILKPVRWISKETGKLWWSKTRFVTEIPKKDFETYKIFKATLPPCDTCYENFELNKGILKEEKCLQVDRFLMDNLQFKNMIFKRDLAKVRVPREYIHTDEEYYISDYGNRLISWKTKRGRKKRNYYFTKLPIKDNFLLNITRKMECCKFISEHSGCGSSIISCGGVRSNGPNRLINLNIEVGSYYQQSSFIPYAGINLDFYGFKNRINIVAGTDINLGFHSAARFQYYPFSFPLDILNSTKSWKQMANVEPLQRFGQVYIGTELKTSIHNKTGNYLEQNIHLGIEVVNIERGAILPRVFIQYGLGFDYLRTNSTNIYPVFQIGVNFKIARLSKLNNDWE